LKGLEFDETFPAFGDNVLKYQLFEFLQIEGIEIPGFGKGIPESD